MSWVQVPSPAYDIFNIPDDKSKTIAFHVGFLILRLLYGLSVVSKGAVAQLGERFVRNEEAVGSIPISSIFSSTFEFLLPYAPAHLYFV